MKVGLSNHLSVCVSPSNNRLVDFHETWYEGNAFQVNFAAVTFNPTSSTILKLFTFKFVSWGHDFEPCTTMVWDCLIVGLLWLHHIQSLANVTMATAAIGEVGKLVLPRTSCFYSTLAFMYRLTHVFMEVKQLLALS
jgi:F0F1-type ATP synthase assembly protein I